MNIYVDIQYSFIREPIKLAIVNSLQDKIRFVFSEVEADLVIGTSENAYSKPCIILTDDPHVLIDKDTAIAISAFPSNADELDTLVQKVARVLQ